MVASEKIVDGFRFMPPSLRAWLSKKISKEAFHGYIPWAPLKRPLKETTFSLMTSAGISMKSDPPFDVKRERGEPTWGDPTSRNIPKDASREDIDVNHLHIKTDYIKEDMNVILPLKRFQEFEEEGVIGRLAPTCYSFYGFQLNPKELLEHTMPEVASRMQKEKVEAVLLTPA